MKKINKKQQGFTLVEVIVVAVIVAVLAAVAIPLYMGYVKDSRTNVCQSNASSVATALSTANSRGQTPAADWLTGDAATGMKVTIPADPNVIGSAPNSITLPIGYTIVLAIAAAGGTVTVTGPNGATSTLVPYN